MKKVRLTGAVLLLILLNYSYGQDLAMHSYDATDASNVEEKIKIENIDKDQNIYISDKNQIFVRKSKKVFLWISNSKDPGATKELLAPADDSEEYFYFDTEGLNTIRSPWAIDIETRKYKSPKVDVVFNVYADGVAPTTRAVFNGNNRYFNSGTVYYGDGLEVALEAYDQVSGTKKIYTSVNNSEFKAYEGSIEFANEDENSITYYSVDNVGNIEDPTTKTFYVDKTPPSTEYIVTGKTHGNIISPNSTVKLLSVDQLSNVKETKFRIGDLDEYQVYNKEISLAHLPDGEFEISYYATDRVNNKEAVTSTSSTQGKTEEGSPIGHGLYLDNTAPEVNFDIEGDQFKGQYTYISERSKIKLVASDNKAGIEKVSFGINQSAEIQEYSGPFSASIDKTTQYINYTAVDKVNNKATNKSQLIYMDRIAPESNITFLGRQVVERDSLFITSDTKIKLSSTDLESGIKNINFGMDENLNFRYTDQFSIEDEGIHQISYNATDNVNNSEEPKSKTFIVDNTPPEISHTLSFPAIGKKEIDGLSYTVLPSYIKIYLAAQDKITGVKNMWYRVNGGAVKEKNKIEYFKKGKFNIQVFAKDHLGNQSETTINIIVE